MHSSNFFVLMQGQAVTLVELGDYTQAASLLEDLIKVGALRYGTLEI